VTPNVDFKVTETIGLDAVDVLCAQLTRDLLEIAKFLVRKLSSSCDLPFSRYSRSNGKIGAL